MTLDESPQPEQGPDDYIRVGDNLVPGWTLALLALALLIAPILTAGDTWLREHRSDWRTAADDLLGDRAGAAPARRRCCSPTCSASSASSPTRAFPFDPGLYPPGASGPIAFAAIAAAVVLAALLVRPMRTPLDIEPQTLAAAAGLLTGLSVFGIWLLNPYLALLLAPDRARLAARRPGSGTASAPSRWPRSRLPRCSRRWSR